MELILIGIVFILFGVSLWWDWKVNKEREEDQEVLYNLMHEVLVRLHTMEHDLQQIKHRLTTIKETTRQDLKTETRLSTPTTFVHTKPKRFKGK